MDPCKRISTMHCRFLLLLAFVVPACKKEEPAPIEPSKIVVEKPPAPKTEIEPKLTPSPTKKKADTAPRLESIDLRQNGLFAMIDAPAGCTVADLNGELLVFSDDSGVRI